MDLNATILFVEAKETGKTSAGVLSGDAIASNQINKAAVSVEGVSKDHQETEETAQCR